MRPHRGWSLSLMRRTETPLPISEGRTCKASRWEHLCAASSLAANRWPHARARLRARENKKSVLAIKLEPKAGCRLKAPDFRPPSRHFSTGAGSSLAPIGATVNRSLMASYQRYSRGNAPFSPSKITYPIETIGSKKPKLLRFMEGNLQRRLLAKGPRLSDPPPDFTRCRGSFSRIGAAVSQDLPHALGASAMDPRTSNCGAMWKFEPVRLLAEGGIPQCVMPKTGRCAQHLA